MPNKKVGFVHDIKSYIAASGSIADRLRLISAGFEFGADELESIHGQIRAVLNDDGGIPFEISQGNPSSVKETSELIPLLLGLGGAPRDLISRMMDFLVSRQKSDGGFAETLNLRALIEDRYGRNTGAEWYPVGKSITWLTGKALEALVLGGYADEERILRARDFLLYSQNEDGHWPDYKGANVSDPLGTGNILPALRAVGINSGHKVYSNGRAALFQHLKHSLETKSTYDMVDLASLDAPKTDAERDVLQRGMALIVESQNKDGGWTDLGSKKSNPELSSLLTHSLVRCSNMMAGKK